MTIDTDWPLVEHSRMVEAGRMRWHVQRLGAGPPLLLIHGTGAATHSWRDVAPLLAERFDVIAFDLPGHGFTKGRPRGGMTLPAVARAVGELLVALKVEPRAIIGHSAGTAIAVRMALDGIAKPDRIIGIDAALTPFPGLGAKLFPTMARLLFVNPFAPQLFAAMAGSPKETERFLERSFGSKLDERGVQLYNRLFHRPAHVAGAIAMMADWDLEALRSDLPKFEITLRLLHGERDSAIPIASVQEAAALVRDGSVEALPGLGHLAHEEAPSLLAERIINMLD